MRAVIASIAFACGLIPAFAKADSVSISTALGVESRYLFRGVQLAGTSLQPSATISWKGFYGSLWGNFPIGNENFFIQPEWQEIDYIVGWSGPVTALVSIDVGLTYFTYPNRDDGFFDLYREDGSGLGFDTLEPFIGASFAAPLSPKLYVYHDFDFDTTTVQGALSHSIPVAARLSVDLAGLIGYVFDDDGGTDYLYGHATANLAYALSDSASLYGGVRFGGSDIPGGSVFEDSTLGVRDSSGFWFGIGLTAKF